MHKGIWLARHSEGAIPFCNGSIETSFPSGLYLFAQKRLALPRNGVPAGQIFSCPAQERYFLNHVAFGIVL
jgi:hypothetical protein